MDSAETRLYRKADWTESTGLIEKVLSVILHRQAFEIFIVMFPVRSLPGTDTSSTWPRYWKAARPLLLVIPCARVMLNTRCDMESSLFFTFKTIAAPVMVNHAAGRDFFIQELKA